MDIDNKYQKIYKRSFGKIVLSHSVGCIILFTGVSLILGMVFVICYRDEIATGIKCLCISLLIGVSISIFFHLMIYLHRWIFLRHQEKITGLVFKDRNDYDAPLKDKIWFIGNDAKIYCRNYIYQNSISTENVENDLFIRLGDEIEKTKRVSVKTIDDRVLIIELNAHYNEVVRFYDWCASTPDYSS